MKYTAAFALACCLLVVSQPQAQSEGATPYCAVYVSFPLSVPHALQPNNAACGMLCYAAALKLKAVKPFKAQCLYNVPQAGCAARPLDDGISGKRADVQVLDTTYHVLIRTGQARPDPFNKDKLHFLGDILDKHGNPAVVSRGLTPLPRCDLPGWARWGPRPGGEAAAPQGPRALVRTHRTSLLAALDIPFCQVPRPGASTRHTATRSV